MIDVGKYYDLYELSGYDDFNALRTMHDDGEEKAWVDEFDLCPKCKESFNNWMEEGKIIEA